MSPIQLPDITQCAMLVRFSVSAWTGRAIDRKATEEIAASHNTTSDVGRYIKVLVSKDAITGIHNAQLHLRSVFNDWTLPWDSDGVRILNSVAYFDFTKAMQDAQTVYDEKVDAFVAQYETLVKDAEKRLNGLFNAKDYPAPQDIRRKFGHSLVVMPMPDARDFRVALSKAEADNVRANIEAHVRKTVQDAMSDAWQRLYDEVKHMATILKEKKAVHDSMRTNLVNLCGLLSKLNITNDSKFDEMRKEVERGLCQYDVQSLRKSKTLRSRVGNDAEAMMKKMEGYMGVRKGE
jgi:hypothetical protein